MDISNMSNDDKDRLRNQMGTLPEDNVNIKITKFYKGVEGITVEIFQCPGNFVKTIVEHVTATWGNEKFENKYDKMTSENKFKIVHAVLTGQTLPQSLEALNFSFTIRGVSRAAFDQHARQRVGAFFQSQGVRDNSRLDAGFRIPTELWNDIELRTEITDHVCQYKNLYQKILKKGSGSFQSARCIMPMNATHNYKYGCNFMALRSYCAQRLMACEMADTVYTAILIREEVKKFSPYLASFLKPRCDTVKKCTYHQSYTLSELFGALFRGCGRWEDEKPYSTFNWSCSDYETMAKEGGVLLPSPKDWKYYNSYDELEDIDKKRFDGDI